MADKTLLTPDQLRQLLTYDAETGVLVWRFRDPEWFADGPRSKEWRAKNWNVKFAGRVAGYIAPFGYNLVQLPGRMECAHRIIWAIVHDEWPDHIDHIDGNRANNALSNLRNVTKSENAKNKARSSRNKSGVNGVYFVKEQGNWCAEIGNNGKKVSLGRYATLEEAAEARRRAEVRFGYHTNHGKRAA